MEFSWDDGVRTYSSGVWLPTVEERFETRGQLVPTLNLGAVWVTQEDATGGVRAPRAVTFTWETADPDFLPIARDTFLAKRAVTVQAPKRVAHAGESPGRWAAESFTGFVTTFEVTPAPGRLTSLTVTVQALAPEGS